LKGLMKRNRKRPGPGTSEGNEFDFGRDLNIIKDSPATRKVKGPSDAENHGDNESAQSPFLDDGDSITVSTRPTGAPGAAPDGGDCQGERCPCIIFCRRSFFLYFRRTTGPEQRCPARPARDAS
jgi:hypothetical protein